MSPAKTNFRCSRHRLAKNRVRVELLNEFAEKLQVHRSRHDVDAVGALVGLQDGLSHHHRVLREHPPGVHLDRVGPVFSTVAAG